MTAAVFIFKAVALLLAAASSGAAATWCVVRSDASEQAMQRALDYACAAGADCAPIQSSGLCYLPNTLQAHASYAINSYYQRRRSTPNSCSFGGAAATAVTDPSYGSCVYPSSPRNAGGVVPTPTTTTTSNTTPTLTQPPPSPPPSSPFYGLNPGMGANLTDSPTFNASPTSSKRSFFVALLIFLLVFFQTM